MYRLLKTLYANFDIYLTEFGLQCKEIMKFFGFDVSEEKILKTYQLPKDEDILIKLDEEAINNMIARYN